MIDDVAAFRAAWRASSAVIVSEKPDAKVLVALDRLALGVLSRVAHGSTVDVALKPFQAAVGSAESTSSPSSLAATAFRDGERWLVDVRMGYASSVSAYARTGKRLAVPAELRWSYRQFGPFFRPGGLLAFDATSLADAGVRYSFRLGFLRWTGQGYASAGAANGFWSYGLDDHGARLIAGHERVVVRSLDSPRSFSVSNAEPVLQREETWDTKGPDAVRTTIKLLDPDLRAADDWLLRNRGRGKVPAELGMVGNIQRGASWVALDFDGTKGPLNLLFDLAVVRKKTAVRRVTIKP